MGDIRKCRIENNQDVGVLAQNSTKEKGGLGNSNIIGAGLETRVSIVHSIIRGNAYGVWAQVRLWSECKMTRKRVV